MAPAFHYLSEQVIFALARPNPLIEAIERAYANSTNLPDRMHCDLPGDDGAKLLIMPAWQNRDAIGVKVATVMPSNRRHGFRTIDGLYVLLAGETGVPRAVLNASALTLVRTAAVSALGARYLARSDARSLLVIGTGALAPHLVRAHAAVRRFDHVMVWGRSHDKAYQLAESLRETVPGIEAVEDLRSAVRAAQVISSATSSDGPLILGEDVAEGTHVDLVGGFAPDMREADTALFVDARVVVDTLAALEQCGDLIHPVREGVMRRGDAILLDELLSRQDRQDRQERKITVFKSVGTALADIAAAQYLFEQLSNGDSVPR